MISQTSFAGRVAQKTCGAGLTENVSWLDVVCRPYVTTFSSLARMMVALRTADFDSTSS